MHNHFDCCREFAKQYSPKGVGEVLLMLEMSAIKIVMLIIVVETPWHQHRSGALQMLLA
jgi:hypothetical protein